MALARPRGAREQASHRHAAPSCGAAGDNHLREECPLFLTFPDVCYTRLWSFACVAAPCTSPAGQHDDDREWPLRRLAACSWYTANEQSFRSSPMTTNFKVSSWGRRHAAPPATTARRRI